MERINLDQEKTVPNETNTIKEFENENVKDKFEEIAQRLKD